MEITELPKRSKFRIMGMIFFAVGAMLLIPSSIAVLNLPSHVYALMIVLFVLGAIMVVSGIVLMAMGSKAER